MKDIRPYKKELRATYKQMRMELAQEEKSRLDEKISSRVVNLWQYRDARIILAYVSTPIEVDTVAIIRHALENGKRVAVPRCIPGTFRMEFYFIDSLEMLSAGSFGVLEPDPDQCEKLLDLSDGLCIVPALSFDEEGYRLGYGKGYYDRFLSHFEGGTVGICYASCTCKKLPHGKYDKQVGLLVTERRVVVPEIVPYPHRRLK